MKLKVHTVVPRTDIPSALPESVTYRGVSKDKKLFSFSAVFGLVTLATPPLPVSLAAIGAAAFIRWHDENHAEIEFSFSDDNSSVGGKGQSESSGRLFQHEGRVYSKLLAEAIVSCAPLLVYSVPILIEGEIGSGKEALARSIHTSSPDSGELNIIRCDRYLTADFEGLLSASIADESSGTLFLDNVSVLDRKMQLSVLRTLDQLSSSQDELPVKMRRQARIIASSCEDLRAAVSAGRFSQELFARLSVGYVKLPTLRDQKDAIFPTFRWFIESNPPRPSSFLDERILRVQNQKTTYADDVASALLSHSWPGNFDELRTCAHRMYMDSRWHGGLISGSMVNRFIKQTAVRVPFRSGDMKEDPPDTEALIRQKVNDVLKALRLGERKLSESLAGYFRRTGLQGQLRRSVSRRIVLAYAKFCTQEDRLLRQLGFVHGKPSDRQALDSADVNMNNFTTFLSELDLKLTTIRDPIKVADLSADERVWLKSLRRKQVFS